MSERDTQELGEQTAQNLEDADDDVTRTQRWFAKGYLTVLFALLISAIGLSVYLGIVSPSITVEAHANIGWIIEYLALFLVVAFIVFTTAMILIALPGSIMAAMVRTAARIADNYEMPESATRRPSEQIDDERDER